MANKKISDCLLEALSITDGIETAKISYYYAELISHGFVELEYIGDTIKYVLTEKGNNRIKELSPNEINEIEGAF